MVRPPDPNLKPRPSRNRVISLCQDAVEKYKLWRKEGREKVCVGWDGMKVMQKEEWYQFFVQQKMREGKKLK